MRLLYGSLLASLALAAPSHEKRKLTPREKAGLPLAKHVAPIKARDVAQYKDLTPVGAPYNRFASVQQIDKESGLGPVVDTKGAVLNAARGIEYITEAEISGHTYTLIVDTGSTDTWIVKDKFQCLDSLRRPQPASACRFGPALKGDLTHGLIPGLTFNISYGVDGGPFLQGVMGYSDVKVAGVHLPKQQVALAERGVWRGDDISSGILGLGLPSLTAALDKSSRSVPYDGFVTTMVKEGVDPLFALALSRNKSDSWLSLGGVPDVRTGDYATAPILKTLVGGYSRYVIQLQQLVVQNSKDTARSTVPIQAPFLIDSGTTLNLFPSKYAETINAMFEPPGRWDSSEGLWFVECNAKPPAMIFNIGGHNITSAPSSMILPQLQKNGYCASGVTTMGSNQDLYILGDTFMQELVVVFDISNKMEVRIANRL